MTRLKRKTSVASSSMMVFPNDTNDFGTMYGGKLIEIMDMVGGICARRFTGTKAVTASIEDMQFNKPINKGDIIEISSKVIWTGNRSLIVKTKVTKEGYTEEKVVCARAYLCFVAINMEGVPVGIPELIVENEKEIKNYNIGQEIRNRQMLEEKRFQIELEQNL